MPYLSQADRNVHAHRRECSQCKSTITNEYCSRCDEFFESGHGKNCKIGVQLTPHDKTTCGGDRGYR